MNTILRTTAALGALALLAFPALSASAQSGPFVVAETGRAYGRLQDAVDAIGGGAGTIRIAPGRYGDCAVQNAGQVTFAADVPGQAIFARGACEGKATLVLRGRSAQVVGLVFTDIAVPDGNGAGIRLEQGDLAVSQSLFANSQQGILTANGQPGTITVDKSTFSRLGTCEFSGGCAHSIYVGEYGALTVTRSRFEAGAGGHYVKSRAGRIAVINCSFDDTRGHVTNYMIDLPAGATGRITGNWFVQGRDKENYSAFVAVAAEGAKNSSAGLVIADNDARFAPGVSRESAFVANWSNDQLAIGYNKLAPGLVRYEKR